MILTVDLETVTRLQKGQTTTRFEKTKGRFADLADMSFSLVLGSGQTRCFIAPDKASFDVWFAGIEKILRQYVAAHVNESAEHRFYRAKWDIADADGDGTLTKREVINMAESMNVHMSREEVVAMFERVDESHTNSLNFEEFCNFMNMLKERYVSVAAVLSHCYAFLSCRVDRSEMTLIWATLKIQDCYKCEPFPDEAPVFMQQLKGYITVEDLISLEDFMAFWCVHKAPLSSSIRADTCLYVDITCGKE